MEFKQNKQFCRHYNQLFKKDPEAANLFLLICELADERGLIETSPEELADLMAVRFSDSREYAL
jgi:hypothetical protein